MYILEIERAKGNEMTIDNMIKLRKLCLEFFQELEKLDMMDHPEVFEILDVVARARGYMIHCEQRGIFGTRLFFGRDVEK